MKKYILILFVFAAFAACTGGGYNQNLDVMGKAVRKHFQYNDEKNGTRTVIEHLNAVSYDEIAADKKEQNEDTYLCKVYVRGKWSFLEGNRVVNMDDTLDCYFDKDMRFLRVGKK